MKLITFFTAENTEFDTKPIPSSESSSKMKVGSRWTVFEILLISAVICVLRLLHGNETT